MKEEIDLREGESRLLFGPHDRHLRITRESFGVNVVARGNTLSVEGDPEKVRPAMRAFAEMIGRIRSSGVLEERDVFDVIQEERARLQQQEELKASRADGGGDAWCSGWLNWPFPGAPAKEKQHAVARLECMLYTAPRVHAATCP